MRSLRLGLLVGKEWRELTAAPAYWLLLFIIGPLVGHGFVVAVGLYAEASGTGVPAALPQGLTPLDGILAPTFGAYDLAATLLLPFVAIRLIAAEKESGALKLTLQLPAGVGTLLGAKALALLAGWAVAWVPGVLAMILWKAYGGHLSTPETLNLIGGHWLRMLLGSGLAFAAAALAEGAASAAIVTLGFTVGTWALDFVAAGRGGWLQQLADYTPTAALRQFEQGLLRLNAALVMLILSLAGCALAAIWLRIGRTRRQRLSRTAALLVLVAAAASLSAGLRRSWDLSENRRNSFAPGDEAALRQVTQPLGVTVYLAAEDPRLMDFERGVLRKLGRVLPRLDVVYAAGSRSGLFESPAEHYGEIWYEYAGQRVMNRSTTEPVVLEQLYQLTAVSPPPSKTEDAFPGYPLAARPRWAKLIFYVAWPLLITVGWWLARRQRS